MRAVIPAPERQNFPPGHEGDNEYRRALRRSVKRRYPTKIRRATMAPRLRLHFPDTPDGEADWRRQYNAFYHAFEQTRRAA